MTHNHRGCVARRSIADRARLVKAAAPMERLAVVCSRCHRRCPQHRPRSVPQEAGCRPTPEPLEFRSEEHTSELPSLMRISYAVFCLKKQTKQRTYVL